MAEPERRLTGGSQQRASEEHVNDQEFEQRNRAVIEAMAADTRLGEVTQEWFEASYRHEY